MLVFVGVKMLAADLYPIPIGVSLGIVALVLGLATAASWWWPRTPQQEKPEPQVAPEIPNERLFTNREQEIGSMMGSR